MGGYQDIDVERLRFGGWASRLSGLCPKLGCQPQGVIRQRKVAPRGGVDEGVKPTKTKCLLGPQELSFELIVDDGWHYSAGAAQETTREPLGNSDDLNATLWMREEPKRPGVEENELPHG